MDNQQQLEHQLARLDYMWASRTITCDWHKYVNPIHGFAELVKAHETAAASSVYPWAMSIQSVRPVEVEHKHEAMRVKFDQDADEMVFIGDRDRQSS